MLSSTWDDDLNDALKDGTYQIAVVMYGPTTISDEFWKEGEGRQRSWRQAYGERVETVIKKLRAANLAIYWVGLPVMRSPTRALMPRR